MLDQQEQLYTIARMCASKPPSPAFFTLGKAFTQLRRMTPWLQEMPYAPVRYALKHQADAWQRYFRGQGGRPKFKKRGNDSVTLPQDVRIERSRLHFPKIGWMRLSRRGGNPYPEGRPVRATIKRICGKWYTTVCYAVGVLERPDDGTVYGLDMNVGQAAASDGRLFHAPNGRRPEARMKRYQRRLSRQRRGSRRRERTRLRLARTKRRIAHARRNWQHHVSRSLAGGTLVVESLRTNAMTASARGTQESPGSNVRQKAGLNREILATGWAVLRQMLVYKAPRIVEVDPAFTSQTCPACGTVDAASRKARKFQCVACGHADHADVNAARNIRRRGLAQLHGEGRSHQATPKAVKRIGGMLRNASTQRYKSHLLALVRTEHRRAMALKRHQHHPY